MCAGVCPILRFNIELCNYQGWDFRVLISPQCLVEVYFPYFEVLGAYLYTFLFHIFSAKLLSPWNSSLGNHVGLFNFVKFCAVKYWVISPLQLVPFPFQIIQLSQMPDRLFQAFLKAISKLSNYRFLLKWETKEGMKNPPKNVMTSPWLPQQEILGKIQSIKLQKTSELDIWIEWSSFSIFRLWNTKTKFKRFKNAALMMTT